MKREKLKRPRELNWGFARIVIQIGDDFDAEIDGEEKNQSGFLVRKTDCVIMRKKEYHDSIIGDGGEW